MLLDEAVEGVEPDGEAGSTLGPGDLDRLAQALEEPAGVLLEQLGVELLLGGEVLLDERLGDAARAGDVVDRGGVVAALREDREGRLEDRGAPLLAAEALAGSGAHARQNMVVR